LRDEEVTPEELDRLKQSIAAAERRTAEVEEQ
jgi:hypothetical protein